MSGSLEEVRSLREQLSELQDRYMQLEEEMSSTQANASHALPIVSGPTVSSIETLYREKTSALQRELKHAKRSAKEEKILHNSALERAARSNEEQRAVARQAQEEVEVLREKAFDLQAEVERLKSATLNSADASLDTFDGEGQFQMLYRETLAALNEEQEKRRDAAVAARTELQNTRELIEDAKEDSASLRAELEMLKLRQVELDKAYQNALRMLEKEVRLLRGNELAEEVARLRAMGAKELAAEEQQRLDREKQLLMEKQITTMEEVYVLRERLKDYDELRRELFFALVLGLKLSVTVNGGACNVDAGELWEQANGEPFSTWKTWLEERIVLHGTLN